MPTFGECFDYHLLYGHKVIVSASAFGTVFAGQPHAGRPVTGLTPIGFGALSRPFL